MNGRTEGGREGGRKEGWMCFDIKGDVFKVDHQSMNHFSSM